MLRRFFVLVAVSSALLLAPDVQALDVRVLVADGAQVNVRLLGSDAGAGNAQNYRVSLSGGQLALNGVSTGSGVLYVPPTAGSLVEIGGKTYRGGVLLRAAGGKVQGINVVNVEDYLRGVVPAEMPALWPAGALEAQAVVARTYVAKRVNPAVPYDICATTRCQVYPGVEGEHERTDAAIYATLGQVLTYGGNMAETYFSANSGGYTASAAETWGKDLPYLVAQPDPMSLQASAERGGWQISATPEQVRAALAKFRVQVGTPRRVSFSGVSKSGRVTEVTVQGSSRTAKLTGMQAGDFVRALGGKSSRAEVVSGTLSASQPLRVRGLGVGHGVGLSQYGAKGLAQAGKSWRDMLSFYYPGTTPQYLAGGGSQNSTLARDMAGRGGLAGHLPQAPRSELAAAQGGLSE